MLMHEGFQHAAELVDRSRTPIVEGPESEITITDDDMILDDWMEDYQRILRELMEETGLSPKEVSDLLDEEIEKIAARSAAVHSNGHTDAEAADVLTELDWLALELQNLSVVLSECFDAEDITTFEPVQEVTEVEQAIIDVMAAFRKSKERILNFNKLIPMELGLNAGIVFYILKRAGVIEPKTFALLLLGDAALVTIYASFKKIRRKLSFWRKRERHREAIEDHLYENQDNLVLVEELRELGYFREDLYFRQRN